jgi:hypothetical protein
MLTERTREIKVGVTVENKTGGSPNFLLNVAFIPFVFEVDRAW